MDTITNHETAMKYIEDSSPKILAKLTPDQLGEIQRRLDDPVDFHDFRFKKNLKVFGSSDKYLRDIFRKKTIETVLAMPDETPMQQQFKSGAMIDLLLTLDKLIHIGITEKNKKRLEKILHKKPVPSLSPSLSQERYAMSEPIRRTHSRSHSSRRRRNSIGGGKTRRRNYTFAHSKRPQSGQL
jgi:hypothetical protein